MRPDLGDKQESCQTQDAARAASPAGTFLLALFPTLMTSDVSVFGPSRKRPPHAASLQPMKIVP
jgi:hypothetical protein